MKNLFSLLLVTSLSLVLSSLFTSNNNQALNQITAHSNSSQASEIPSIRTLEAKVEKLAGGFKFAEGPVWHPDGFLLFSDIPASTIYKWTPNQKVEIFRRPSGRANGNTLDRENRLISAEHDRRLSRTERNGKVVTLATHYAGKRLNSPNDVVVKSDGSIYFTDPPYGISEPQAEELGFYGIYRLTPAGQLTLLNKDMERPNGIAFSPDEKQLYVTDSQAGNIHVFAVNTDGTLANRRILAEMKVAGKQPLADGIKVDSQGNLYATGPGGIWVFSPRGRLQGKIPLPENLTNLAWGDNDYQTLYVTADNSLYRIRLKVAGIPAGKG